jgi:MinD superfamily P-loop ATPase
MNRLVVLSGKGGTGKTTVTAALAQLASQSGPVVLVDADVDAANLELLLGGKREEEHPFVSGEVASIDPTQCAGCGLCADACRFEAIQPGDAACEVDSIACEGCRACHYQCPEEAIEMLPQRAGSWFRSGTRFGQMFHARLLPGQENSGKLVSAVRDAGVRWAEEHDAGLVLLDGPPGIGCPVIAASSGATLALLVAEPTVSGLSDLERALGVAAHLEVPAMVCVNKADLNPDCVERIEQLCAESGVDLIGGIPFDDVVEEAASRGLPVTEIDTGPVRRALGEIWRRLSERMNGAARLVKLRAEGAGATMQSLPGE